MREIGNKIIIINSRIKIRKRGSSIHGFPAVIDTAFLISLIVPIKSVKEKTSAAGDIIIDSHHAFLFLFKRKIPDKKNNKLIINITQSNRIKSNRQP
jgi:hypothetical protein